MVSAGANCVKCLLFCFNLLFVITGIGLITVGALIRSHYHIYETFLDESFLSVPAIFITVGVIVFVVAFFGCCGAVKDNHCMIITFSVFLILIFILELAGGIAGYVKHNELEAVLERRFNETLPQYYNNNTEPRHTWDIVQFELNCCGINGPEDWPDKLNIPTSCCNATMHVPNVEETCILENAHKEGCMPKLLKVLQENALVLGAVGIGIALVQLLGVIFACCLAKSIRHEYQTV